MKTFENLGDLLKHTARSAVIAGTLTLAGLGIVYSTAHAGSDAGVADAAADYKAADAGVDSKLDAGAPPLKFKLDSGVADSRTPDRSIDAKVKTDVKADTKVKKDAGAPGSDAYVREAGHDAKKAEIIPEAGVPPVVKKDGGAVAYQDKGTTPLDGGAKPLDAGPKYKDSTVRPRDGGAATDKGVKLADKGVSPTDGAPATDKGVTPPVVVKPKPRDGKLEVACRPGETYKVPAVEGGKNVSLPGKCVKTEKPKRRVVKYGTSPHCGTAAFCFYV